MTVNMHTHGPDEGRGLDCGETLLADGSKIGWCRLTPVLSIGWEQGAFAASTSLDHGGHNATNPYTEES